MVSQPKIYKYNKKYAATRALAMINHNTHSLMWSLQRHARCRVYYKFFANLFLYQVSVRMFFKKFILDIQKNDTNG